MFIFIDESGDDRLFILSAVIVKDGRKLEEIVKKFRRVVKSSTLKSTDKAKINQDPKEYLLYDSFPSLLGTYIGLIRNDHTAKNRPRTTQDLAIVTAYCQLEQKLQGDLWISAYEQLFLAISETLTTHFPGQRLDFIFDKMPQASLIRPRLLKSIPNCISDTPFTVGWANGRDCLPLHVADITAGTSRRQLNKFTPSFYHDIKSLFLEDFKEVRLKM